MADLIRSRPFSGVLIVTPWEPFSTAPLAAPVSSRSSPKEPSDAGALCGVRRSACEVKKIQHLALACYLVVLKT